MQCDILLRYNKSDSLVPDKKKKKKLCVPLKTLGSGRHFLLFSWHFTPLVSHQDVLLNTLYRILSFLFFFNCSFKFFLIVPQACSRKLNPKISVFTVTPPRIVPDYLSVSFIATICLAKSS